MTSIFKIKKLIFLINLNFVLNLLDSFIDPFQIIKVDIFYKKIRLLYFKDHLLKYIYLNALSPA